MIEVRVLVPDDWRTWRELRLAALAEATYTFGSRHVSVPDVDAMWNRAVNAGAEIIQPLGDTFWGERYGQLGDPFGHRWGFAQRIGDVSRDEVVSAAAATFGG